MGEAWKGGDDMANNPGGGHKINLLREEVKNYKDKENLGKKSTLILSKLDNIIICFSSPSVYGCL